MIYLAWIVFVITVSIIANEHKKDNRRTESFTPFQLTTFQKTRGWIALTYIFWFYFGL